jgi:hypothetical protein
MRLLCNGINSLFPPLRLLRLTKASPWSSWARVNKQDKNLKGKKKWMAMRARVKVIPAVGETPNPVQCGSRLAAWATHEPN